MHKQQISIIPDFLVDKSGITDYNILKRIFQGAVSLMIIVPQRGIDVNRKEEKIMKVKVRKRKPAPVAEEQGSGGVYVPRIFIDYIPGLANVKDTRRTMRNIKEKIDAMHIVDMQVKKIDKSFVPVINIDMGCMMRNAAKKVDKGNC